MIKWTYEKVECRKTTGKFHRGRGGSGNGYVCNGCGAEQDSRLSIGPLRVYVVTGDAHICDACAPPWLALVSKLKIAPESQGVDVTDYTTPPALRADNWCEGCDDEVRRAGEEQRDRGWLRSLLQKVGL